MKDRSAKKTKHEPSQRCTACDKDMRMSGIDDMKPHPLLKVLICARCFDNYGDGDFTKYDNGVDEEGDDNYCRWCADGGDLLVCCAENCHYAYCKKCIKRNLGRKVYSSISDSEDWRCFACDKDQLSEWVDYAEEMIEKARKSAEKKEVEKKDEKQEKQVEKTPEPSKASVHITPSFDTSFTPSVRKKEARAKKSTGRPARIFDEANDDQDDEDKDSDNKSLLSVKGDEKSSTEKDKENEKKHETTKENDELDESMRSVSIKKSFGGEGDCNSSQKVIESDTEKSPRKSGKGLQDVERSPRRSGRILDDVEKSPRKSGKGLDDVERSPRRSGRVLDDVVIEEKDEAEEEVQKTPQRKLCEDVVIEDNEELDKDKEANKSERSIDKYFTSTPARHDSNKLSSTTIEAASEESDDEAKSGKPDSSPQKRKSLRNTSIGNEQKKRRTTRSSLATEGLNGEKRSSKLNMEVNTIIQQTSTLTTEYIRLFGQLRDSDELDSEIVAKIDELTGKLYGQLHSNTVSIHKFETI